ncbi:hypothetical protein EKH55_4796 [Sinorhizobium alkalisoli]|nr:hypothetical protein EKH55_4796 [Sinorhizobium alkalisoli]
MSSFLLVAALRAPPPVHRLQRALAARRQRAMIRGSDFFVSVGAFASCNAAAADRILSRPIGGDINHA